MTEKRKSKRAATNKGGTKKAAATEAASKAAVKEPVSATAAATAEPEDVIAAAPEEQLSESETIQLVTFLLADDEFGFHIEHVQEIIRLRHVRITPIPNAPELIEGVVNLRGRLIPAIDLRKRLDRLSEGSERSARVMVVSVSGRVVGLIVDAVLEVAKVGAVEVEDLPDLAAGVGTEFVEGVCRAERGLVVVLDLELMFSEEEGGLIDGVVE